jgi:hypothetical protein
VQHPYGHHQRREAADEPEALDHEGLDLLGVTEVRRVVKEC